MHVSVVEVHRKLDVVIDEIRREGAHTRAEISQDIKEEGKLTREAIQQTMVSLGKFPPMVYLVMSPTLLTWCTRNPYPVRRRCPIRHERRAR